MKQLLLFGCFVLCISLNACQCSEPPPIGPVEGENAEAATVKQSANARALA